MIDLKSIQWQSLLTTLDDKGYGVLPAVLSEDDCNNLIHLYANPSLFRNTINMQRYRFGKGEYKYFNYDLPPLIQKLREGMYGPLASLANEWMKKLSIEVQYPHTHEQFINDCNNKGQHKPTPLMLRYEVGGFNTLHQDLYGEVYFPFQIVFVLNQQGKDYEGGEFVITEQIPRAQSKATVITLNHGDAFIFTTNFRAAKGSRGFYRASMKHGVSELKFGIRYALGIIFHDAQ